MTNPTAGDAPPEDPRPGFVRRHRVSLALGTVVGLAVVFFLAFGVFGIQTLFIDEKVEEAGPVFDSGAEAATTTPSDTGVPSDAAVPSDTTSPITADTTAPEPVVTTVSSGTFDAVDHPGNGTVNLLSDGTQAFVRFEEDFSTDNGPDLFAVIYVGGDRIELGSLKGNQGSQNYELPGDIDPAAVEVVAVWCKRFDATFTEASLRTNAS